VNVPGRFTATALATRAPGQENRRWRGPLSFSFRLIGSGAMQRPCNARPEPASLRVAPALRIRFVDFQPDPVIAVTVLLSWHNVAAAKRKTTGDSAALWECRQLSTLSQWERAGVRASSRTFRIKKPGACECHPAFF